MGLRVTSKTDDRWWLRVGLRTAVFLVPSVMFSIGVTRGLTVHLLLWLLTILLFSTARRGNGWTGVHELLSRTRVVQRNVRPVASAAPKMSPVDLVPDLSSLRRIGPYAVHTTVGETGGGRLFVGVDPILRRHVWIHEVAPGTPRSGTIAVICRGPAGSTGSRAADRLTENWDAFEAPGGEPLLSTPSTSDWREVHRSLSSLTIELDASVREEMNLRPTLPQVWKRPDGHLVLLDFPWPGLAASDANQHLGPVELLAAVSEATRCTRHGAGRAPVGHDAVASTGERVAASAR